jgi:TolB-like protein
MHVFAAQRQTVAVIPFNDNVITSDEAIALSDVLENRLAKLGRFDLVERKAIENIMDELNFGTTDFVDQSTAVRAGRLFSSQWLLLGSVSKLGNIYLVNVKLVNTETGMIVTGENGEAPTIQGLKDDVEAIAKELSTYILSDFKLGIEAGGLVLIHMRQVQSYGVKASCVINAFESISIGAYASVLRRNSDGEVVSTFGGKLVLGDPRKKAISLSIGQLPSIGFFLKNIGIDFYPNMLFGIKDSFGVSVSYLLDL